MTNPLRETFYLIHGRAPKEGDPTLWKSLHCDPSQNDTQHTRRQQIGKFQSTRTIQKLLETMAHHRTADICMHTRASSKSKVTVNPAPVIGRGESFFACLTEKNV